jgi:hypothetical protein
MKDLALLGSRESRSISAENFTGEKGQGGRAATGAGERAARDLGQGWKVSPCVSIKAGTTFQIADLQGPGEIEQIWMTPAGNWRFSILRIYWDDQPHPSVECPVGDFFACGWGRFAPVASLAVCVNPGSAFNCYWQMPFRKKARITMQNMDQKDMTLYYQVNYTLTSVPKDAGYFHAQFRREAPLRQKGIYTMLDGVKGQGQYVGTYLAWGTHSKGWWGEGEIKFFMDGDKEFPTICGTGTEDYFLSSYGFPRLYSTPFVGVTLKDGAPENDANGLAGTKWSLYRWHVMDPIRFQQDLSVTIQALGWEKGKVVKKSDDIASVAYWYQREPHAAFPALPPVAERTRDARKQ